MTIWSFDSTLIDAARSSSNSSSVSPSDSVELAPELNRFTPMFSNFPSIFVGFAGGKN